MAMGRFSRRRARALALAGVALPTVYVLYFRIGLPSWNFDEYFYAIYGRRFLEGHFDQDVGVHPYFGTYLLGILPATGSTGTTAVRLAPATAALATGALLFLFARRLAGYWAGLLALALWALLPHASVMDGVDIAAIKIERFGLLDALMELFLVAALYAGWRWTEGKHWAWAVATGVCAGLATASKLVGALVLLPIVVLSIVTPRLDRRRLAQTIAVVILCPVVLLMSFLPVMPEAPDRLRNMLDLARAHEALGHAVVVGGDLYEQDPPWWSNAWFMWEGMGPFATIGLVLAAVAGVLLADRRLALFLGLAVAVPFLCLATVYGIALPHYYFIWVAPLTVLAALGLRRLFVAGGARRAFAAVPAFLLAAAAAGTVINVTSLQVGDYRLAAEELDRAGVDGRILVSGFAPILAAYLEEGELADRPASGVDAVVVDRAQSRRTGDPRGVQRWVRLRRDEFDRRVVDHLTVFIRRDTVR
jgi:4-amino-4-deoxy-L-arabinose transferase-like glycosyltransferase